jgi:starvation-inducible DNA-binding protein
MKSTSATQIRTLPEIEGGLGDVAVAEISESLRNVLADVFALYLKTKNFHWHMSGRYFRDYHLLLDEQGAQLSP